MSAKSSIETLTFPALSKETMAQLESAARQVEQFLKTSGLDTSLETLSVARHDFDKILSSHSLEVVKRFADELKVNSIALQEFVATFPQVVDSDTVRRFSETIETVQGTLAANESIATLLSGLDTPDFENEPPSWRLEKVGDHFTVTRRESASSKGLSAGSNDK